MLDAQRILGFRIFGPFKRLKNPSKTLFLFIQMLHPIIKAFENRKLMLIPE